MASPKAYSTQANNSEIERHNLGLAPHQIILRPLVTEKGMHKAERYNSYAFEVNRLADKHEIRHAVQELFSVKVISVRTQNRKGKPRRTKYGVGTTKPWKKAVVTLHEEDKISFF